MAWCWFNATESKPQNVLYILPKYKPINTIKYMKQKLKNSLLLFLFGMFFVSCELQEEAIKENERNENFKFSQKKFEELMTNKNFKSSFDKLQKSKNTSNSSVISRTIMEDMYGFTIADKPAKVLQTNDFTTYTFLIQRDSLQSTNYFENLVIKTDSLNNTQAVILKYTPFTPLLYLQNHNSSYFNGEVEGQFIIYNNQSSSQSRMVYGCEYSMGLICTGDSDGCGATAHPVTESCVYFTPGCISPTVLGMSCGFYDDGLGGSGGTSTSDSGSGGGSGSSPNGDTTEEIDLNDGHGGLTTVTVVPEEEIDTDNPCDKIKSGTNSVDFKTKFKELNTQENYNKTYETGYGLVGSNYVDGIAHPTRNSLVIPENSKNLTHIHNKIIKINPITNIVYDAGIKMLSVSDLKVLIRDIQPLNTNPQDAFVVMASNEGIFAISILESTPWNNELENKLKEFKIFYLNGSDYIIENFPTMNALQRKSYLEKMFLKGLSEFGLENKIGLFEGVVENENDSNIENYNIKWARKTLKKVFLGYNVEEAPCAD
jgi:hypothetical protein